MMSEHVFIADFTMASSSECPPIDTVRVDEAISYFYLLLFPIALVLNGVAGWVSLHLQSTSTFLVYLKNLVAADLLMTLMLPPIAASQLPGATEELRVFDCRISRVIFYGCLYTSIALMALISIDRFFKVVRPGGKVFGQNVVYSFVMSALAWVVFFYIPAIPTIILTNQDPRNTTKSFCTSLKSPAGESFHKAVVLMMEFFFWLVSIVIVFCYICITLKVLQSFRNSGSTNSQGKKTTKLRVFLILIVFFVCFLPLHIARIPFTLNEIFNVEGCTETWAVVLHKISQWLCTTNACLDPLLYIFLCREYRDKLLDMMRARGICVSFFSGQKNKNVDYK